MAIRTDRFAGVAASATRRRLRQAGPPDGRGHASPGQRARQRTVSSRRAAVRTTAAPGVAGRRRGRQPRPGRVAGDRNRIDGCPGGPSAGRGRAGRGEGRGRPGTRSAGERAVRGLAADRAGDVRGRPGLRHADPARTDGLHGAGGHGRHPADGLGPDSATPSGYTPQNLQAAYGLAAAANDASNGESIAIVDAYNDPKAASDLAEYRKEFGLPACTTAGKCLAIGNQVGGTKLPKADPTGGWELEESHRPRRRFRDLPQMLDTPRRGQLELHSRPGNSRAVRVAVRCECRD